MPPPKAIIFQIRAADQPFSLPSAALRATPSFQPAAAADSQLRLAGQPFSAGHINIARRRRPD